MPDVIGPLYQPPGAPPDAPPDATAPAGAPPVAAGLPAPAADGLVDLVNPHGTLVGMPPKDVVGALQHGYHVPTPEEAHHFELVKKHSGPLEGAKSFAEGVLGTVAPFAGPAAEAALLGNQEEQLGRREVRGTEHALGAVTGAIAPLAVEYFTGGLGTPAAAPGLGVAARALAELSAPGMIARAGGAINALGRGGSALARIGSAAADQAAQSALFSSSEILNRAVLGDPKLTAESMAAEVGLSTIIGGGLGALGGAMSRVAEAHGKDFAETLRDMEASRNLKAAGGIQRDLDREWKQMGEERLNRIARYWGENDLVGPMKSFDTMMANGQNLQAAAARDMTALKVEASARQAAATAKGGRGLSIFDVVTDWDKDGTIRELAQNPTQQAAWNKIQEYVHGYVEKFITRDPLTGAIVDVKPLDVMDLHDMRMQLGEAARGWMSSLDPIRNAASEATDRMRRLVSDRIDSEIANTGLSSAAWKDANFRWQAGKVLEDFARKGAVRSGGNNAVSPMEAMGIVGGLATGQGIKAGTVGGMATALVRREGSATAGWALRHVAELVEGVQARATKQITDGVSRLFSAGTADAVAEALEHKSEGKKARFQPLDAEQFAKFAPTLNQHANMPNMMADLIEKNFGPVVSAAAPVAQNLLLTAQLTAQQLADKVPPPTKVGVLDQELGISPTDLAMFNRHLEVADDPFAVLDHIDRGTLTSDHVAAVDQMYPALANQMRQALSDTLAEKVGKGEFVPFHLRFGLGAFLGQDLERATTGAAVLAAQQAYAAMEQSLAKGGNTDLKMRADQRSASSTQGVASRLG